jgi:hypothetical protein
MLYYMLLVHEINRVESRPSANRSCLIHRGHHHRRGQPTYLASPPSSPSIPAMFCSVHCALIFGQRIKEEGGDVQQSQLSLSLGHRAGWQWRRRPRVDFQSRCSERTRIWTVYTASSSALALFPPLKQTSYFCISHTTQYLNLKIGRSLKYKK